MASAGLRSTGPLFFGVGANPPPSSDPSIQELKKKEENANADKQKKVKVASDIVTDVFPDGFDNTSEDKVVKKLREHTIFFCKSDDHVEIHKIA